MAVKTSPYFSKQCNGVEVYTGKEPKTREEEEEEEETAVTRMELHIKAVSETEGGPLQYPDCFNNHYII